MKDTFDYNGVTFTREIVDDEDHGPPWKENDGHGVVTDWINIRWLDDRSTPRGHWTLNVDGYSVRYYNWFETMKIAKEQSWGLSDEHLAALQQRLGREPTAREIRKKAVRLDFEYLQGWCQNEWRYVGVVVTHPNGDNQSLWGIESDARDYHKEVARDLASEILTPISAAKDLAIAELGG